MNIHYSFILTRKIWRKIVTPETEIRLNQER